MCKGNINIIATIILCNNIVRLGAALVYTIMKLTLYKFNKILHFGKYSIEYRSIIEHAVLLVGRL